MSNRPNPTLIGLFVVGAVVLATVAVLIFGSGKLFKHTTRAVCFFTGDVMGLNVGSPVKFKGVDVGSVAEVRLRIPEETDLTPETVRQGVRMPVIIEIDNDKVTGETGTKTLDPARLKQLIELGLRAQLVSQSLVTGLLLVKLDFQPDIPPTFVLPRDSKLLEIPTSPTTLQQIQAAAQDIVRRLEAIDLERLVGSTTRAVEAFQQLAASPRLQETIDGLPATLANVNSTLSEFRTLAGGVDRAQGPLLASLKSTSDTTGATLHTLQSLIAPDAPFAVDLATALHEMAAAARSVRLLADSLDRNPSSLVRGTEVRAK